MYWEEEEMRTEYAVHIKSNDGKEEHILGHYTDLDEAIECANKRKSYGNRDVYLVTRMVTEWTHFVPHKR